MSAAASMPGMAEMPGMPGMSAGEPASVRSFALAALMWWTMMVGMMVPSAAPMILLFGTVQRRQLAAESPESCGWRCSRPAIRSLGDVQRAGRRARRSR